MARCSHNRAYYSPHGLYQKGNRNHITLPLPASRLKDSVGGKRPPTHTSSSHVINVHNYDKYAATFDKSSAMHGVPV